MPPALFEAMLENKANAFMVGLCDGHTVVNAPAAALLVPGLQQREAANLAAWLVMVAHLKPDDLNAVFRANGWPDELGPRQRQAKEEGGPP